MGSGSTVIKSKLYSYKLGKECANFELKICRAHMKCKLYDKLGSSIWLIVLIKHLFKFSEVFIRFFLSLCYCHDESNNIIIIITTIISSHSHLAALSGLIRHISAALNSRTDPAPSCTPVLVAFPAADEPPSGVLLDNARPSRLGTSGRGVQLHGGKARRPVDSDTLMSPRCRQI